MNKAKKALDVLNGDCTNPIIKADMIRVLERELAGNEHSLDMAVDHNVELAIDIVELKEKALKIIADVESMTNGVSMLNFKQTFAGYAEAMRKDLLL